MIISRVQKLNWSLRYKVGLAFLLILICFCINGIISGWLILNMGQAGESQRQNGIHLQRVQFLDLNLQYQLDTYSTAAFSTQDRIITEYEHPITDQLLRWSGDYVSPAEKEFENKFGKVYFDVVDQLEVIRQLVNKKDHQAAVQKYHDSEPAFKVLTDMIKARQKQLTDEGANSNKIIKDNTMLSILVIGSLTLFSIFLVFFILWLNENVFLRPLNKLQKGLEKIADGDFEQQLEIQNQDEIGKLAKSFSTALGFLQQMVRGVRIGEQLQAVTGQLTEVSKQQKEGANEQVSALLQVANSMEELEKTASKIADSAAQVVVLSNNTLSDIGRVATMEQESQERTQEMALAVSNTLGGIEKVGKQVEEFSQLMGELNQKTIIIEKVVELLASISDEVHLLALNASIEAAGAGQYGERFRVVAQQVKQLAGRANKATDEATGLIRDVQHSCQQALHKVDEGLEVVREVSNYSRDLDQTLEVLEQSTRQVGFAVVRVNETANQVNIEAQGIRHATAQQQLSNSQVIGSVQLVEKVANQNAKSSQQLVTSSFGLEGLTHKLNEILGQVKLTPDNL